MPHPSLAENLRFFLGPYCRRLAVVILAQVAVAALSVVGISAVFPAAGGLLGVESSGREGGAVRAISEWVDLLPFADPLINAIVFFLAVTILAEGVSFGAELLRVRTAALLTRDWNARIFEKVLASDYRYFLDRKRGDVVHVIMVCAFNAQTLFQVLVLTGVGLQLLLIVALLSSVSVEITMLTLLGAALLYGPLYPASHRILVRLGEEGRQASARQYVAADEALRNLRVLKVFDVLGHWKKALRDATEEYTRASTLSEVVRYSPALVGGAGLVIALGGGLLFMRWRLPEEFLATIPVVAVFLQGFRQILNHASQASSAMTGVTASLPYADRLRREFEASDARIASGSRPYRSLEREIRLDSVTYAHDGRETTLSGVSFSIERGSITALVGPSGAGKSTVVDLLLRLYDVNDGAILVDGVDLRELDLESWRRAVGFVGQEPFLFNATIAENIAVGKPGARDDEIEAAARLADAHEFIVACDDGYQTRGGDRGARLSGGQRQRIALARALIREPDVLILDEATSSLDMRSEAAIQGALEGLRSRYAQLVVAHRLSTVRNADKIVVLDQGRVVQVGRHEELLAREGLYADLYRRQATRAAQEPRKQWVESPATT